MKRTASLILAVFAMYCQVSAQSVLRVRLADNTRFNVSVNGRYFDRKGTSITVGDLPAGNHYVKIFKVSYDRWGRVFDRTIFQGTVRTRNGMVSHMVYDPYAKRMGVNLVPDSNVPASRPAFNDDQNRAKYNDVPEPSRMAKQDRPVSAYEPEPAQVAPERNNPPSDQPPASPMAEGSMTDSDVEALKGKVDGQKTDTEKLKLLKSELRKETITTFQLATMLDWLLFESTKVELAKWAYYITKDKDFFSDIFYKFGYQSSKDELKQFAEDKK